MIAPDSSVVIASLARWHTVHRAARVALRSDEVRLPAHVAFETTSSLSRMPEGRRVSPTLVLEAIERSFPRPWLSLDGDQHHAALRQAIAAGVRGGSLYDALIAVTVSIHGVRLLSADRRAQPTYEAVGADVVFLEP